jgi:photosystem II stability/assembly factor-like uncharacterized protein
MGRRSALRLLAVALAVVLVPPAVSLAQPSPPPRALLLDATLAGPGTVIAVGERGTVLLSTDAGRTWTRAPAPVHATLTGVSFAPGSPHGWAVGHDALILTSADSGRTWTRQFQGENLEDSFLDVLALDTRHVLAVGAYGLFYATTDGGATWTRRPLGEDDFHFNRLTSGPTGKLYLAGERGTLLRSSDRGATWTKLPAPYEGSFYGVFPLAENILLAHGLRGRVFRSTDDGGTWNTVETPAPVLLATAARTADGALWLAGQARTLLVSRDDGRSFSAAPHPPAMAVAELLPLPGPRLLAFGELGPVTLPFPAP